MSVQINVSVEYSTAEKLTIEDLHKVEKALDAFESKTVERTLATAMVFLIYKFCNLRFLHDETTVRPLSYKQYTEELPYQYFVDYVPTTYDKDTVASWSTIFDTFNNITGYSRSPHFITKKFINDEKPKRRS